MHKIKIKLITVGFVIMSKLKQQVKHTLILNVSQNQILGKKYRI